MKILFVEDKLRTDKLGFLYLSSILKESGHTVDLCQDSIDSVENYLPVDFIMYSVMSGDHEWFLGRNAELKRKHSFISVMGGPHFTFFPEQGLEDPNIDFVVQGPGEGVIVDLVEGRLPSKLIRGELPNVNSLPMPDRSILYQYDEFGKSRMKRFIAGRYCYFNCNYCFNHLFKSLYRDTSKESFYQRLDPNKMVDEIRHTKDVYGLELAYFNDDDLAASKDWLIEFCDIYLKRVGVPFCGSVRASSVGFDLLKTMADAGCNFLNLAIESANPKTQRFLRRGNIKNEQIEAACNYCEQLGIKVRLQNMIGLPVEDPLADALETLEYNIKINPTDSWASIFQPFPKTDLWKYCLDKGLITEEMQVKTFYSNTQLKIENSEKIDRLHKWWFFAAKYQLPIELIKILIEIPIDVEQLEKLQNYRWELAKNLLYGM